MMNGDFKMILYLVFHLNLFYSSVAEKNRRSVIERCYWPILNLAEELKIPVGIEVSVRSLEAIKKLEPKWITRFEKLLKENKCELIGSGYMQIIGPLVPAEVNHYNQIFGIEDYKKILNYKPKITLVSEQAYSSGLIDHFKNAGYKAVMMEWNNPYRFHPEWHREWRYHPQIVCDSYGNSIPVIWNNAIAFQKFQRYAHGEIEIDEYIDYLKSNIGGRERLFAIYGNDAEIFDFRPGRFYTEARIHSDGEWNRIKRLIKKLKEDERFRFVLPSKVLKYLKHPLAGNALHLESPEQPIPVKKQGKYNITRWAVTGKNDTEINTKCYKIYNYLQSCNKTSRDKKRLEILWKKLCYLWGSDFRTHIEEKRWQAFRKELCTVLKQVKCSSDKNSTMVKKNKQVKNISSVFKPKIEKQNSKIKIETGKINMTLNTKKGLAVDSLIFKGISTKPLVGTIPHGYYDDISFGADYFTAHTIIEESGKKKVTDLESVEPVLSRNYRKGYISAGCSIQTRLGTIKKEICIFLTEPFIDIKYTFDIRLETSASIRTGIVTFLPGSFDAKTLYYKTVNGGFTQETFCINKGIINHAKSVDKLISANHCLGATEGWAEIGDENKYIRISTDKSMMYSVPMIEYQNVAGSYFLRCYNSISEIDDTVRSGSMRKGIVGYRISAKLKSEG